MDEKEKEISELKARILEDDGVKYYVGEYESTHRAHTFSVLNAMSAYGIVNSNNFILKSLLHTEPTKSKFDTLFEENSTKIDKFTSAKSTLKDAIRRAASALPNGNRHDIVNGVICSIEDNIEEKIFPEAREYASNMANDILDVIEKHRQEQSAQAPAATPSRVITANTPEDLRRKEEGLG